jgi:hypothetical protein
MSWLARRLSGVDGWLRTAFNQEPVLAVSGALCVIGTNNNNK